MNEEFDKYHSIPFFQYYSKKNGTRININYERRTLSITDADISTVATVHFSNSIKDKIDIEELLNKKIKKNKAYYVYENGTRGNDWLWYYGDLVSIEELLL